MRETILLLQHLKNKIKVIKLNIFFYIILLSMEMLTIPTVLFEITQRRGFLKLDLQVNF